MKLEALVGTSDCCADDIGSHQFIGALQVCRELEALPAEGPRQASAPDLPPASSTSMVPHTLCVFNFEATIIFTLRFQELLLARHRSRLAMYCSKPSWKGSRCSQIDLGSRSPSHIDPFSLVLSLHVM